MSDEPTNNLNEALTEGLKRGAYAQIGGQAANNSGNAYAQKVYQESPPSLIAELRNRKAKTALLLGQNEDERKRLEAQYEDLDRAIAALTPAPEAEPGSGHGEIETKLPPPDPFLTELLSKGGTWHDGGPNPAPDKFVDIYVPAASTNLGDRPNYLEGQPSNAYVWTGWEVAYRISEPAGEGDAVSTNVKKVSVAEGYQHVVDAEPAGGDDVPRDADGREVDLDSGLVCMRDKHPEPDGEGTPVPGGLQLANGTKPDLPDDTLVDILYRGDWGMPRQKVGEVRWSDAAIKFWHLSEPAPLIIADPSSVEELGEQSEPYSAAHEAEEPLTLDQMDEAGITDPDASAMLRMMTARKLEGVE